MEKENDSMGCGCLTMALIVDLIFDCIFFPAQEFKGYYIVSTSKFASIRWTISLWVGYIIAAAIVVYLLYLLFRYIGKKIKG